MKRKRFVLQTLILVVVLPVLGALGWAGHHAVASEDVSGTVSSTFKVEGMTCGGCEAGVRMKVKKLDGVESVEASYKEGIATVVYHPDKITPERIIAAIEELGYSAELQVTATQAKAAAPRGLRNLLSCC